MYVSLMVAEMFKNTLSRGVFQIRRAAVDNMKQVT